ncbi:MAG TPA: CARDB domain-containing protein [Gaiellaceae bacterium]|nr:CARDB domain-containing protein [Gaiellaceae bacterium]
MRRRLAAAVVAATALLGLAASSGAHEGAHAVLPIAAFGELTPSPLAPRENVEYVGGDNGFTGGHVAVEAGRLYLGSYGNGMRIYDIANPADPKFLGSFTPGLRADAPPDAAVLDGRHIAVLNGTARTHGALPPDARTDRTEFLDVTDPANPKLLWTFGPDQIDGESHNGDIVDARRLYLPSGGRGVQGLRIYDLNPLVGTPAGAPQNIFRGNPTALWEASPYRNGRPVGAPFTHTHDIEVYVDHPVDGLGLRDIALLAEGGSYLGSGDTGSVFVIDVTDPRNPVVLLRWLHEKGPDHHPIRYHHEAQLLESDPSVMLITDEDLHNGCGNAGGITAVRLAPNLQSATELSEWFVPFGTPAPVCSVHVFSSEGPLVFLGSYNAGLQVVDYSDPANPRQVGHFIAEGTTAWGALYHRGYVYVGDMSRGLDVFRYTGPRSGLPDLTVSRGSIGLSNHSPSPGENVTVTARVRNAGTAATGPVTVRFTANGVLLGERVLLDVPPGGTASASVAWTPAEAGTHELVVTVDPADAVDEEVEANNAASRNVKVK